MLRQPEDWREVRRLRQLTMPTVKTEPPPLFNWFSLPYAQYERARREEEAYRRKWWADFHRTEAFARAQQGGN